MQLVSHIQFFLKCFDTSSMNVEVYCYSLVSFKNSGVKFHKYGVNKAEICSRNIRPHFYM